MDTLKKLLKRYKAGDKEALDQIIVQMTPLVKKYAGRVHFMEKEDSMQEFYITLLETIKYLDENKSEGECLAYMKRSVMHKFAKMCNQYITDIKVISGDEALSTIETGGFSDTDILICIDFEKYIQNIERKSTLKGSILRKFWYENKSDADIADSLKVSRQYVHRVKKIMIKEYLDLEECKKTPLKKNR